MYPVNEQQVTEIDKVYDEIRKFNEPIKNLAILLYFLWKTYNSEEKIELIEAAKEKISRLKAELECKQDLIMQEESDTFKIFLDYHSTRIKALDELYLKEIKLRSFKNKNWCS